MKATAASQVRATIAEIDRLRSKERGAESLRCSMRLCQGEGSKIITAFRFRYFQNDKDAPLTRGESDALYEALGIVSNEAAQRAEALEATLSTTGDQA